MKQVTELLNKKLIYKSSSSWNFSILFIKKSEDWQIYVNFQELNTMTEKNRYLLSYIQKCLD